MPQSSRAYSSLDDSPGRGNGKKDSLEWYWRLLAFLASWMILAGFLSIQPLLDSNDGDLHVSKSILAALAIAFLAAGFTISALAFIVSGTWRIRFEIVCLPGLYSCSLGLFALIYPLATSSRFSAGGSAGFAGLLVATLSILAYVVLSLLAYYKSGTVPKQDHVPLHNLGTAVDIPQRDYSTGHVSPQPYVSGHRYPYAAGDPSISMSYYPASLPYPAAGGAPVQILTAPPPSVEEEETRLQMSRLLSQDSTRHTRQSPSDTYRIDWQGGPSSAPQTPLLPTEPRSFIHGESMVVPPHVQDYYDRDEHNRVSRSLVPNPRRGNGSISEQGVENVSASGSTFTITPLATPKIPAAMPRSRSREARRREIELGGL